MMTNAGRARVAGEAMEAFRRALGMDGESLETVVGDFLCNLRHLCDRERLAFHEIDRRAYAQYVEERGRP